MKKILVVEDNLEIQDVISNILIENGYEVKSTSNAFEALDIFHNEKIECIITDLMLPIMSGEEFIEIIRKESNVHVIIISAKDTVQSKLEGLRKGADDYLVKPFLEEELIIKVNNYFKKNILKNSRFSFNNSSFVFIENKNQITLNSEVVPLTAVEYLIVSMFVKNPGIILSRNQILDKIHTDNHDVYDRVVDTHIKNIRIKLKKYSDKEYISTVYGLGYKFVGDKDA